MNSTSRKELLRKSWSQIAEQYEQHLVPRFMPWCEHTLQKFLSQTLPSGPVIVPACGPGHELVMLAAKLPTSRQIIGIDLAPGMVDVANQCCHAAGISDRARAETGDACDIASKHQGAAGIVSLFGLQQLPEAHLALANWVEALAPAEHDSFSYKLCERLQLGAGGVIAVAFWPQHVEKEGPWQRLADLSVNKPTRKEGSQASKAVHWEELVPEAALKAGAHLIADEQPSFSMHWSSIDEFWEVMTQAGPWHTRRLHMGEEHMERLRAEFMSLYSDCSSPIRHEPHARLIVMQRNSSSL